VGAAGAGWEHRARRLNQEKVMKRAVSSAPCLGACPVVPGGCPHPTAGGWWIHPNHRQLHKEVLGTPDPTRARYIRCLRGVCEARCAEVLPATPAPLREIKVFKV